MGFLPCHAHYIMLLFDFHYRPELQHYSDHLFLYFELIVTIFIFGSVRPTLNYFTNNLFNVLTLSWGFGIFLYL
jgi:hypothetical protein